MTLADRAAALNGSNLEHQWSGWPGAYCLLCGAEDATETILACHPQYLEDDGLIAWDRVPDELKQGPCPGARSQ